MRKKVIVDEFKKITKPGVFVMDEKTNFNAGIMMDIEDEIRISYNYDASINTSINLTGPNPNAQLQNDYISSLSNLSYDNFKLQSLISIEQDKTQTEIERNTTTKWIFEFDSNYLLKEYLYNEIFTANPSSPFYSMIGILDGNKLKDACYDYINKNLLNRYRLKEFILWTEYYELKNNIIPGTGSDSILNPEIQILYKNPVFNYNAIPLVLPDTEKKTISIKSYADNIHDISYKQTKSSQYFTFIYYFDVIFEKI
jgi:hypothetical protein